VRSGRSVGCPRQLLCVSSCVSQLGLRKGASGSSSEGVVRVSKVSAAASSARPRSRRPGSRRRCARSPGILRSGSRFATTSAPFSESQPRHDEKGESRQKLGRGHPTEKHLIARQGARFGVHAGLAGVRRGCPRRVPSAPPPRGFGVGTGFADTWGCPQENERVSSPHRSAPDARVPLFALTAVPGGPSRGRRGRCDRDPVGPLRSPSLGTTKKGRQAWRGHPTERAERTPWPHLA
jgi:hypothetical protein